MLLYTIDRVPRLLLSDGPRLSLFGFFELRVFFADS